MASREENLAACGPFSVMFQAPPGLSYLSLLHLGSPLGAQEIARIVRTHSGLDEYVLFMLREQNWRPQLVAAAAAVLGLCSESIVVQLWQTFDSGSWVSPQLAAALSQVDVQFVEHAIRRLKAHSPITGAAPFPNLLEQHVAKGSAGSTLRSCKAVAALLAMLRPECERERQVTELLEDATLIKMVADDVDAGGEIATRWRDRILAIKNTPS